MRKIYLLFCLLLTVTTVHLFGQQANIPKNSITFTPWTTDVFPGVAVGINDWNNGGNVANVILNNTSTATGTVFGTALGSTDATDSLRITHTSTYSAGNIVGFRGSVVALSTNISIEISAWNGTNKVSSRVYPSSLLGDLLGSGTMDFTLVTTAAYNAVQIKVTGNSGLAFTGGVTVQYAIVKAFEAGPQTACNTPTVINAPSQAFDVEPSLTAPIGVATYNSPYNLIDNNAATTTDIVSVVTGGAQIAYIDRAQTYTDPYFVGFDIRQASLISLSALGTMQIRTYLNGTLQETVALSDALVGASVVSSNTRRVGFVTSLPFNTIQFYQNGIGANIGNFSLVNLIMTRFCAAPDLNCNETVSLTNPDHSVYINSVRSGVSGGACVNCSVDGAINVLDSDPANFATLNMVGGAIGSVALSVKDAMRTYPANTYAGFDITTPSLLNLTLLSGLRVETYLNNVAQETFTGANLLGLGSSFVGGITTSRIGFLAGQPFDEIRLVVLGGLSANVGATRVYNAFVTRMCDVNTLSCNTPETLDFPTYPVLINSVNTGITSAGCVGCSLNNTSAILDNDPATFARLTIAGGVLTTARVSVKKAVTPFGANTFIGIPIQANSLASLDLFNAVKLIAYNNGVVVSETNASTNPLMGLNSGLLFPTGYQVLGFVPAGPFDEVVAEFTIPASISAGNIDIYDVVVQQFCNQPIDCDETIYLNEGDPLNPAAPGMPVYVNYGRTGPVGGACVGCSVANPQNVISASTTDYATINLTGSLISGAGISVVDAMNVYPVGTYAGFTVQDMGSFAELQLLSGLTVETYLNGTLQESGTAANLISLEVIGIPIFGSGSGVYNVGFKVTKDFNEIRLIASEIAGVGLLNGLRVYGAWADTRESNGGNLYCHKQVNPDMNVAIQNVTIAGNLKSNDIMPSNAIYSAWTPHPDNPAGAVIVTNPDGTYTFTSATVGSYVFFYEVCVGTQGLCYPSFIKITVTPDDNSPTGNYPVIVNPDYGNVLTGGAITVKVVSNDAPGNDILMLNLASLRLSTVPSEVAQHGIAVVNPDGSITYTPTPGFTGKDSLKYYVSDNHAPTPHEGSAWVIFSIYPADYVNTVVANDDFFATKYTKAGNVLDNDSDPEGDMISVVDPSSPRVANNTKNKKQRYSVSARTVTTPEGVLDIQTDGSFTFVPAPTYAGTYQHVYTITDDNAGGAATASATLSILVSQAYTLPIVVSEFDVKRENGVNVLRWKTSLEENASHFGIERSIDGVTFTEIARISADNRSSYKYEDAFQHNGKVYYRLKLVDLDETAEYSSVKFVETENRFNLSVHPNPAVNGRTYLNTGGYSGTVSVRISDAVGRTVAQKQLNVQQNATVELPLLPSQKGIYYIMVLDSQGNRILQTKILNQ
ncbi:Ig-like domain-containing protein [Gynurincola endophyticus]|uniref:Ig-like domain-containing protein n=1 Tax=Gynurincola endophyticus TaxID=2479004 RepID=UPI000F8D9620|nr:cadherin-like domain-containing protein [Gynurincola endophyticus]